MHSLLGAELPPAGGDGDAHACCPDCGAEQRLPVLPRGFGARCYRCGAGLGAPMPAPRVALGLGAACTLLLLLFALELPLVDVEMEGAFAESTLTSGPNALVAQGLGALAVLVLVALLFAPAAELVMIGAAALLPGSDSWRIGRVVVSPLELLAPLARWSMLDIFLVGVLIAWNRMSRWMLVDAGPALVAVTAVAFLLLGLRHALEPHRLRHRAVTASRRPPSAFSLTRTAAFTLAGVLLYVPANVLPITTIRRLNTGGPTTVLGGVETLLEHGSYFLAAVVFVASVLVPLLKLLALVVMLVATWARSRRGLRARTRVYRLIEAVGRWSMLDLLVLSLLTGLVHFGRIGFVLGDPGALAFGGVVVLTMLATHTFEPRLMWDAAGANEPALARAGAGA